MRPVGLPGNGEARVLPIYQSTTFKYDSAEHVGKLFDLQAEGFFYTRLANPTVDCVEKKIADLRAVLQYQHIIRQSALLTAVLNLWQGDHIVSSIAIYGGTINLFNVTLKRMGIDCTFVDIDAPLEELQKAIRKMQAEICRDNRESGAWWRPRSLPMLAHDNDIP